MPIIKELKPEFYHRLTKYAQNRNVEGAHALARMCQMSSRNLQEEYPEEVQTKSSTRH